MRALRRPDRLQLDAGRPAGQTQCRRFSVNLDLAPLEPQLRAVRSVSRQQRPQFPNRSPVWRRRFQVQIALLFGGGACRSESLSCLAARLQVPNRSPVWRRRLQVPRLLSCLAAALAGPQIALLFGSGARRSRIALLFGGGARRSRIALLFGGVACRSQVRSPVWQRRSQVPSDLLFGSVACRSRSISCLAAALAGPESISCLAASLAVPESISCLAASLAGPESISCLAAALAVPESISCLAAALAVPESISCLAASLAGPDDLLFGSGARSRHPPNRGTTVTAFWRAAIRLKRGKHCDAICYHRHESNH